MDIRNRLRYIRTYDTKLLLKTNWRFRAYKNTGISISESASLNIQDEFNFGERWTEDDPFPSLFHMGPDSSLIVKSKFDIFTGSKVYVNKAATLILGSGYINHNLSLSCFERIEIGDNVAISENVTIRDSDNHYIVDDRHIITKPVIIGNHVWIGMNVTILKGVSIGDGSVIAAGAVVTRNIPANSLAVGVPAKIVKENINWK